MLLLSSECKCGTGNFRKKMIFFVVLALINVLSGIFPRINNRPALNKRFLDRKMLKINKIVLDSYSEVKSKWNGVHPSFILGFLSSMFSMINLQTAEWPFWAAMWSGVKSSCFGLFSPVFSIRYWQSCKIPRSAAMISGDHCFWYLSGSLVKNCWTAAASCFKTLTGALLMLFFHDPLNSIKFPLYLFMILIQ